LNGVKAFDVKLAEMLDSLESTLEKHDETKEGALSWPQFRASMEELNAKRVREMSCELPVRCGRCSCETDGLWF
jgi:hypothetical protein